MIVAELDNDTKVVPDWNSRLEQEQHFAHLLFNLYVAEGVEAKGQFDNVEKGKPYGWEQSFDVDKLLWHVQGRKCLATRPVQGGFATWIGIDVDDPTLEQLEQVVTILDREGLPFVVNFSGQKGYHFTIYFREPITAAEYEAVRLRLASLLGDLYCTIPTGKQNFTLPCGPHWKTGQRGSFVTRDWQLLADLSDWISELERADKLDVRQSCLWQDDASLHLGPDGERGLADDEIENLSNTFPLRLHRFRGCINQLWVDGIPDRSTRHLATLAIVAAILNCREIPERLKWPAMQDWIRRTYPKWIQRGCTETSEEAAMKEAKRLMKWHTLRYAPSCNSKLYGSLLRKHFCSAQVAATCVSEPASFAENRRDNSDYKTREHMYTVLRRAKVFSALGRVSGDVYQALIELAVEPHEMIELEGYGRVPVMKAPRSLLAEMAGCHVNSVGPALQKLARVGLVVQVGTREGKTSSRKTRIGYALPTVDDARLVSVIESALGDRLP